MVSYFSALTSYHSLSPSLSPLSSLLSPSTFSLYLCISIIKLLNHSQSLLLQGTLHTLVSVGNFFPYSLSPATLVAILEQSNSRQGCPWPPSEEWDRGMPTQEWVDRVGSSPSTPDWLGNSGGAGAYFSFRSSPEPLGPPFLFFFQQ
jgi:hypothetical protein